LPRLQLPLRSTSSISILPCSTKQTWHWVNTMLKISTWFQQEQTWCNAEGG